MGAITATSQSIRPVGQRPAAVPADATAVASTAADHLVRQNVGLDFPGITAGKTHEIKGNYKGHGFGGKATVNSFDGKILDLSVNASAMFGLVKVKVHLRFEANPDGTVSFLGERVGKEKGDKVDPDAPEKAGAKMKVLANRPGLTVLQAPDGNKVTLAGLPGGGLQIAYDQYRIALKP